MIFYLGTHRPKWLEIAGVPLFISHRRMRERSRLPRASSPWALDSGAFTEIGNFGRFETEPSAYADAVALYADKVGMLSWASIQDWMCEPQMVAKTGKSVDEHQSLTIESYLTLRSLAPEIPWAPVVQGWATDDYLRHVDAYITAGVDLSALPVVGVGSVCKRQSTSEAAQIFVELAHLGLRLHAFGMKTLGLPQCSAYLESSDSFAWSSRARWEGIPLDGCHHKTCHNCLRFALLWRESVLASASRPCQSRAAWGLSSV